MLSKEQLLEMFPEYRPTVYHVDMNNNIDPVFSYYEQIELEDMYLEKLNKDRKQGELFL